MCKRIFFPSFLFVVYLHSIFAIKCPSCFDISIDKNSAFLPANKSYCEKIEESAAVCRSELFINFIGIYSATINYIIAPLNALITVNGDNELVTTINVPLDIGYPFGSVLYNCYDKDLCNDKIIQKQYEQLQVLNGNKLVNELTKLLYNNKSISQRNQTECYTRNGNIEKCAIHESCQATLIIEQGRSDSLMTACIPDRRPGSISGLILQSKSVGNDYKKTIISYTCNKNTCNHPDTVKKIREILIKVDLVRSKANSMKFVSIVLFIMCIFTNIRNH